MHDHTCPLLPALARCQGIAAIVTTGGNPIEIARRAMGGGQTGQEMPSEWMGEDGDDEDLFGDDADDDAAAAVGADGLRSVHVKRTWADTAADAAHAILADARAAHLHAALSASSAAALGAAAWAD